MKKLFGILLFGMCIAVAPLRADEVKPLQLKEGEKYQLRLFSIQTMQGIKSTKPVERKTVSWENYEFSVTRADRKKGFVLEMERKNYSFVTLQRTPQDRGWREVAVLNNDIEAPRWPTSMRETFQESRSQIKLSPDYKVLSFKNENVKDQEDVTSAITEIEALFSAGKEGVYHLSDTLFREQYPKGILLWGDWSNTVYEVEKRVQSEIRFCRIDTRPFSVANEGKNEQTLIFKETNATIYGEIGKVAQDTFIRVSLSRSFPVYSKQVFRVPVVKGKFEFRTFVDELVDYRIILDEKHSLHLEAGDELTVRLDALGGKGIGFEGLGAGNNRYYHGEGSNWGYSLYRIDREKMCSRDYYAELDKKTAYFRNKMEARKGDFTLGFYQYMLDFFKYRTVYQKLMDDRDSTVSEFECIEDIEICNPLALGQSEYMMVLRHIMLMVMPKRLSLLTGSERKIGHTYDMAGLLLDGKVQNAFLVEYISEQLYRGDYEKAKELYERYRKEFIKSPYTEMLEEQYLKSQLTAPGAVAPDFTLKDEKGKEYTLSDFRGKVVYLDFWSMGCGPCMYEFKNYAPRLKEHYRGKDVVFLNIMAFTKNKAYWKKMIEEYRIGGVNVMDTQNDEVCKAYHATSFPTYILIGKDGKIIKYNAYRPSQEDQLRELIDEALK